MKTKGKVEVLLPVITQKTLFLPHKRHNFSKNHFHQVITIVINARITRRPNVTVRNYLLLTSKC